MSARNVQQEPCQSVHSELRIDRCTCTPHRRAHTHVVVGAADGRKGRSRLARLARGRADGRSSWQQEEHTVQAALSFSPPGRLSCAAARAMSGRAEYSSFLDAFHLGGDHGHQESCAGRPGTTRHGVLRATRRMDGGRNILQVITKRHTVTHLGVDPVCLPDGSPHSCCYAAACALRSCSFISRS